MVRIVAAIALIAPAGVTAPSQASAADLDTVNSLNEALSAFKLTIVRG